MLVDHCTWDDDYKSITQKIRKELLELAHVDESEYTAVLMQGSGTFGVESVVTSSVGKDDKILVCENGAYGARMAQLAKQAGKNVVVYHEEYSHVPDAKRVKEYLDADPSITHVGVDIDVKAIGIDFIISSANKCIQGVPGFSFIICKKSELMKCKGNCGSLSLDLYDQWETMQKDGKWRFTSPTHVVLAFAKAMEELKEEGGISARAKRYRENNQLLIRRMRALGIETYIDDAHQGPIITTFFTPKMDNFSFAEMYEYIKKRGYAIYPGKVTDADTFRIGNIGEIYKEDIEKVSDIIEEYFEKCCGGLVRQTA